MRCWINIDDYKIYLFLNFLVYIPSHNVLVHSKYIESLTSWKDLSEQEYKGWYSTIDRCIIKHSITVQKDPRKLKRDLCGSTETLYSESGQINVGYGYSGKICIPSLYDRIYFRKGLTGYTNPLTTILISLLKSIHRSRRPLIFLGDSMTGQTYDAFFAELYRINDTYIHKAVKPNVTKNSLYKKISDAKGSYDNVQMSDDVNDVLGVFMLRVNYIESIENSTFYEGNRIGTWKSNKLFIEEIIDQYNGAVIIANVGLWYNSRNIFKNEIKPFIDDLHSFTLMKNKNNTIFWRESTASHFDKLPSGYFKYRDSHHMNCLPSGHIKYNRNKTHVDDVEDWRNIEVNEILQHPKYDDSIFIIQFYDITRPLYNMHLIQRRVDSRRYGYPSQVDCNHYCWMPTLWQPVWSSLASVI